MSGVGAGADQLAGVGVDERQRRRVDANSRPVGRVGVSAASSGWPASEVILALVMVRSASTAVSSVSAGGSGGGPTRVAPSTVRWARSAPLWCERWLLTRTPAISEGIASRLTQKRTARPGPRRAEPELSARDPETPPRWNHLIELDRFTRHRRGGNVGLDQRRRIRLGGRS